MNRSNDKRRDSVFVRVLDVAALDILAPRDSLRTDSVFTPTARVRNLGNTTETFPTFFAIIRGVDTIYNKRIGITLAPESTRTISFPDTFLSTTGWYRMRFWAELLDDMHPENNFLLDSFKVYHFVGLFGEEIKSKIKPEGVKIKSNPIRGPITVSYHLSPGEPVRIRIYNPLGEIIYAAKSKRSIGQFPIGRLPAGIYLLQIETLSGYREERKLIVLKWGIEFRIREYFYLVCQFL